MAKFKEGDLVFHALVSPENLYDPHGDIALPMMVVEIVKDVIWCRYFDKAGLWQLEQFNEFELRKIGLDKES